MNRLLLIAALSFSSILNAFATPPGSADSTVVHYYQSNLSKKYPFSDAVQAGNLLFLSGQIGIDSTFTLVPGGMEAEARQALENIKRVLAANGCTMDNVVKCTVMLTDMNEWPAFNAIYKQYFRQDRLPARSAIGCSALALGARIEIECIAAMP